MRINAAGLDYRQLNELIDKADGDILIDGCEGQRFIGSGCRSKTITINGVPGNALGAYLDGAKITVNGNAQDAVGDTMNDGEIVVHGQIGDAMGYAMRGGRIYVRGNAGYRAGIHMKAYKSHLPVMVIGGSAGSFLGEYQAGGIIIVLGIACEGPVIGNFCGTGMHGGKIYLRCEEIKMRLPEQVKVSIADEADIEEIKQYIEKFAELFGEDREGLLTSKYYVLEPNSANPYKQLYVQN